MLRSPRRCTLGEDDADVAGTLALHQSSLSLENPDLNVNPKPAPAGSGITPLRMWKFVGIPRPQGGFLAAVYVLHPSSMFGVDAANCRMFTEAAPVLVLCGQIHIFFFVRHPCHAGGARNPPL